MDQLRLARVSRFAAGALVMPVYNNYYIHICADGVDDPRPAQRQRAGAALKRAGVNP